VGLEIRVIKSETPNSRLAANPTKARKSATKSQRSGGARGWREGRSDRGVTNSGPGTRTCGACGRNVCEPTCDQGESLSTQPNDCSCEDGYPEFMDRC